MRAIEQHQRGAIGTAGRRVLLANVVAEVGIVITGGLVRLTGSGLGCPSWPECTEGSLVPIADQSEGFHKFIEFGNRLLTFAVLVAAVAALVVVSRPWLARRFSSFARWAGPPGAVRPALIWLAIAGIAGIAGQAALGGVTVLLDLHPATVAAHFLLSMAMVAVAFLLYVRAGEAGDYPVEIVVRRELRWIAWAVVALGAVVLVLGTVVTGAGPHSGDDDVAVRFDLDVRMMSWLHADVVLVFIGLCVAFALGARLSDAPGRAAQAGALVLVASAVQGVIGYTQYFAGVPIWLVALHMLGACGVWLASLNVLLSTRRRGGMS
ncbi:MAG TPA: COX15/CtaA family protein [Actinomycetes bacterium]|nr:COX15/CtaA family protein [Actinomycetes bacterium]